MPVWVTTIVFHFVLPLKWSKYLFVLGEDGTWWGKILLKYCLVFLFNLSKFLLDSTSFYPLICEGFMSYYNTGEMPNSLSCKVILRSFLFFTVNKTTWSIFSSWKANFQYKLGFCYSEITWSQFKLIGIDYQLIFKMKSLVQSLSLSKIASNFRSELY